MCLAIMQTTSSQPGSKAQLMWVLESSEPESVPIEKPQEFVILLFVLMYWLLATDQ